MKIFKKEKTDTHRIYTVLGLKIRIKRKGKSKNNAVSIPLLFARNALVHDGLNDFSLELLKSYLFDIHVIKNESNSIVWLSTITALCQKKEESLAQSLFLEYVDKFGLNDIHLFDPICTLSYNMGFRNKQIINAYETYKKLREIRSQTRFEKLVKSARSIAIVGRSPCLIGKNLGEEIDSHDLVIRFNNSDITGKHKADYGVKINVGVINMWVENLFKDKNILCVYRDFKSYSIHPNVLNRLSKDLDNNIDFLDYGLRNKIYNETGLNDPTSGALFIIWVKKILGTLDKVDIYGFAFQDENKSLKHFDADHKIETEFHNMEVEINFLKNLTKKEENEQ